MQPVISKLLDRHAEKLVPVLNALGSKGIAFQVVGDLRTFNAGRSSGMVRRLEAGQARTTCP
jgi:hypothetical protein